MPARDLAIVISPEVSGVTKSAVGGRPVGEYLIEELRKLETLEVRLLIDRGPTNSGAPDVEGSVQFPLSALDARDFARRAVLVIDARAWLPRSSLIELLSRARESPSGLRVVTGDSTATGELLTLAVYFPVGQMRGSLNRARTVSGQGIEHVLSEGALDKTVSAQASELGDPGPRLLIQSYLDVFKIEEHVLLDRAHKAMERGLRIRDPRQVWIRGDLVYGSDVEIDVNVILEGSVVLGNNVRIGAHSVLRDARIGDATRVHPFSLVEGASVGADCTIGPYARIRPTTTIRDRVQIGNFVELKNADIAAGCRINHHSFIGDATIAEEVTIGAGTITCNHDGVGFNQTVIERGAYIGSGCNLVAPVRIGEGATIGAGSTITRDVPPAQLTLARAPQTTVQNWRGPKRR